MNEDYRFLSVAVFESVTTTALDAAGGREVVILVTIPSQCIYFPVLPIT